jgi:hypothetical protein
MVSNEQLYKFIKTNNIVWICIRDQKDNILLRLSEEGKTPDYISDKVKTFLEDYPTTEILGVEARSNPKSPRDQSLQWELKNTEGLQESTLQGNKRELPAVKGIILEDVQKMIAEAVSRERENTKAEQREREFKIKESVLNDKIKELETWGGKLAMAGTVAIEHIIKNSPIAGMLAGIPTAVNKTKNIPMESIDLTESENESLNLSIDRLLTVFTVLEIEQISKYIEQNSDKKSIILSFLK